MGHKTETLRSPYIRLALFCLGLLVCMPLAGCGDSCIVIVGIFAATTSTTIPPPACTPANSSGTVNVRIAATAPGSDGPMAPNLQHLYVSIRGIEAHSSEIADADSADWQELDPELARHPVQIDLMESKGPLANSCPTDFIRKTRVRADAYRQIRIRLVPDQPEADEAVPGGNACAGIGFNCAVTARGEKRTVTLENGAPYLHISPERIANGFFRVLPDTETEISIEFNPYASVATPAGDAIGVVPILTADSNTSCNSRPPSQ